jgi:hypothetical protein
MQPTTARMRFVVLLPIDMAHHAAKLIKTANVAIPAEKFIARTQASAFLQTPYVCVDLKISTEPLFTSFIDVEISTEPPLSWSSLLFNSYAYYCGPQYKFPSRRDGKGGRTFVGG